jgi:hypothetical protein
MEGQERTGKGSKGECVRTYASVRALVYATAGTERGWERRKGKRGEEGEERRKERVGEGEKDGKEKGRRRCERV